jgi:hypothetical protein
MNGDCIWCRIYKRERDEARQELAQSLTNEERLQIARLRTEIRRMQLVAEERNRQLDAMHWVWCSGGCPAGIHRFDGKGPAALTQAIVDEAVRNTERLKRWWGTWQYRLGEAGKEKT